jgi:3-deoxy-D-manno-octulosonate 8-phosphate phosphatase (KDO 8-P phosphatase)
MTVPGPSESWPGATQSDMGDPVSIERNGNASCPARVGLLVLDVDGVLTDGTVMLMPDGGEVRSVHFHDLDAVAAWQRRGLPVAVLSGEGTPGVQRVAQRFRIEEAVWGAKEKLPALIDLTDRLGIAVDETCYVGDADRDAPVLRAVGIGLAPSDGTPSARAAADHVLAARGGHGAVAEAIGMLDRTCQLVVSERAPRR